MDLYVRDVPAYVLIAIVKNEFELDASIRRHRRRSPRTPDFEVPAYDPMNCMSR